jgi:hypothetical protein|tara:strand:+ start:336 stop:500 length:165 start_codon:yes stop_codon:yes gene_type:complete
MKLWRWSLYTKHYAPEGKDYHQVSGQEPEVRDAMNHVASVVEKLVQEKNDKCLS